MSTLEIKKSDSKADILYLENYSISNPHIKITKNIRIETSEANIETTENASKILASYFKQADLIDKVNAISLSIFASIVSVFFMQLIFPSILGSTFIAVSFFIYAFSFSVDQWYQDQQNIEA